MIWDAGYSQGNDFFFLIPAFHRVASERGKYYTKLFLLDGLIFEIVNRKKKLLVILLKKQN